MCKYKSVIITIGATILFLSGCASVSNFKTAKPLGKGTTEGTFSVSHIATINQKDSLIPGFMEEAPSFTFFEFQGMLGLTEKFDVGLRYTFPTSGAVEAKYCLVGAGNERGFYLAPGCKLGYTTFPKGDNDSTENSRLEFFIPLYLSYYMTSAISLSCIPSYAGRYYAGLSGYSNLVGGSVNMRFGKRFGLIVEGSYYHNFNMEWDEYQVGGAFFFPLVKLFD